MKRIYSEWKIHFSWLYPTASAVFIVLVHSFRPLAPAGLYLLFEVVWPLGLILSIAPILPLENEESMLELRLSYAEPYQYAVLRKIALPYLWWFAVGILAMLWCLKGLPALNIWQMLPVVVPPAVLLAGVALLISSLTLHAGISVLVTLVYWVYEWLNAGNRTRHISLFPYYGGAWEHINIGLNRVFLVLAGIAFTVSALLVITRKQVN